MSRSGPNPPHVLQIQSLYQVATDTPSHVPLRRRGRIITIFRGFGTSCLVPSDRDLASKCVYSTNFISYSIGESPILSAAGSGSELKQTKHEIPHLYCCVVVVVVSLLIQRNPRAQNVSRP